ncbi:MULTISPECIES: hypothetical protein [unclassified Variovorax]|uniref:hypothetical protein n=1 Tax=unclassified Variovorax TaxID=663243 RepID=UPI003F457D99
MTAGVQRFIDLTPQGALISTVGPAADLRGRLLRALLLREPHRAWSGEELAQLLPHEQAHTARALFGLHRVGWIAVSLVPPAPEERHWASLQLDLESLIDDGATLAALLDHDGFVIAQAGGDASLADDPLSAPRQDAVQLHVGDGALRATYGFALQGTPMEKCPSLVRLIRRLACRRSGHEYA